MYRELLHRQVRPRKNRECAWCAEQIPQGAVCDYRTYVSDGELQSSWMHPECWRAMLAAPAEELTEGWIPGDYQRGSIEWA